MSSVLTPILLTVLTGISFPLSGSLLQHRWNNQLGDVYSLGLGSAACLGGAFAACFGLSLYSGSLVACLICTLCYTLYDFKVGKVTSLLTFGMLFGSVIGACGTIVANNASPEALQEYYHWSSGTYFNVPLWQCLPPLIMLAQFPLVKSSPRSTLLYTSLLCSFILSSVGFVGMISLVCPNFVRLVKPNLSFKLQILYSCVLGVTLLSITNLLIYLNPLPIYLPASATMSIVSLPLLIYTTLHH